VKVFAARANFPVAILTVSIQKRTHRGGRGAMSSNKKPSKLGELCGREKKSKFEVVRHFCESAVFSFTRNASIQLLCDPNC
jgi:hypothetical protein